MAKGPKIGGIGEGVENYSLEVGNVPLGANEDGTLNIFPLAELEERTAARDRQEKATAYAADDLAKVPQERVDYRLADETEGECSICAMFMPGEIACSMVRDPIFPDWICDLFEAKP